MSKVSAHKNEAVSYAPKDPLLLMEEELELLHRKLAHDAESKQIEFERFREETLWRLNSMSERTIEIARLEESEADVELIRDRAKWDERVVSWRERVRREVLNDGFLDDFVDDALTQLLESGPS